MNPFLVAAYIVFWVGISAYVLTLGVRQQALARRIEALHKLLQKQERDGAA